LRQHIQVSREITLFIGKPNWKINNDLHSYKSLDSFVGTFVDKNKLSHQLKVMILIGIAALSSTALPTRDFNKDEFHVSVVSAGECSSSYELFPSSDSC